VHVGAKLLQAAEVDFLPCSDLFLDTLETFRNQPGDNLSFTDSAIVTLARRHAPGFVASFDKDLRDIEGVSVVPA
jgi:predicted nucleic acid-binding protein